MDINLTGKSWADKTAPEMTVEELGEAITAFQASDLPNAPDVATGYAAEWERRFDLDQPDELDQ